MEERLFYYLEFLLLSDKSYLWDVLFNLCSVKNCSWFFIFNSIGVFLYFYGDLRYFSWFLFLFTYGVMVEVYEEVSWFFDFVRLFGGCYRDIKCEVEGC